MNEKILKQIVEDYIDRDECERCVCCKYEDGVMLCPVAEYDGYEHYPNRMEYCEEEVMKAIFGEKSKS